MYEIYFMRKRTCTEWLHSREKSENTSTKRWKWGFQKFRLLHADLFFCWWLSSSWNEYHPIKPKKETFVVSCDTCFGCSNMIPSAITSIGFAKFAKWRIRNYGCFILSCVGEVSLASWWKTPSLGSFNSVKNELWMINDPHGFIWKDRVFVLHDFE